MHLAEAVTVFVTGILFAAMAYCLVLIAPQGQVIINAVLVSIHKVSRLNELFCQRFYGWLSYV